MLIKGTSTLKSGFLLKLLENLGDPLERRQINTSDLIRLSPNRLLNLHCEVRFGTLWITSNPADNCRN